MARAKYGLSRFPALFQGLGSVVGAGIVINWDKDFAMNNLHRCLLWFLAIDLAVSALVLIGLLGARRGAGAYAAEASAPASSSGVVSTPETVLPENGAKKSGEAQGVGQDIRETRRRVQTEVVVQAEEMSRFAGYVAPEPIELAELEKIAPETYRQCQQHLASMREEARRNVQNRQALMEQLDASLLSPEEFQEFREALEYLQTCEVCLAEGRPVPERLAKYDWQMNNHLEEIAEKYCRALSGCNEDVLQWKGFPTRILGNECLGYHFISSQKVWEEMQR